MNRDELIGRMAEVAEDVLIAAPAAFDVAIRAALRVLDQAGMVIVPREPSDEMVDAGDSAAERETYDRNGGEASFSMHGAKSVWTAMIAASLQEGQQP